MSGFKLEWDGQKLSKAVTALCVEAVNDSAEELAEEIRRRIPVSAGTPKTSKYRQAGQHLRDTVRVNRWQRQGQAVGAYVSVGYPYLGYIARFIELGTPGTVYRAGKKKGKPRTPIKAKPFMRPALRKFKGKFKVRFEDILK